MLFAPKERAVSPRSMLLVAAALLSFPPWAAALAPQRPCAAEPTDMQIHYEEVITCESSPAGDIDHFRIPGNQGDVIAVQVTRTDGGQPCVEVRDPSNVPLGSTCGNIARVDVTLPSSGAYTIRVWENGTNELLNYELWAQKWFPPTSGVPISINPPQERTGATDYIADVVLYRFDASNGARVPVQVTRTGGGQPCFDVRRSNNQVIRSGVCGNIAFAEVAIDADDTYTIRVWENGLNELLNFNILAQCFGNCPLSSPEKFPFVDITLTGCNPCTNGQIFSANLALNNLPPPAQTGELKFGLYRPDGIPFPVGDPHQAIPAPFGFEQEVIRFTVQSQHPRGTWQVCGRLLERAVGREVAVGCQTFSINP
jgi:hypothetical protein